mgnify:CR=1 FL=1
MLVLVDLLLEPAFARARPPEGAPDLAGYAFPGGHAAGALAFYGLLAVLAGRLRPALRGPILLAAGTWVAAVWVATVAVRAHHPSDVLAGAAVGAASLFVCLEVDRAASASARVSALPPRPRAGA